MATLTPKISFSQIQNNDERKVAEALMNQLSDSSTVIHSFNWLNRTNSGSLIEGECDLNILCPERELLIIEVKSI